MANSTSPEAKELNLISKAELRIALADSDIKLEAILKTFLAPLLLKLASENVNVRNKVCRFSIKFFVLEFTPWIYFLDLLFHLSKGFFLSVSPRLILGLLDFQVISICQHINTRIKSPYVP